jgi:RNA polymerase sigma-70 factor, ECF subfamily
MQEALPALVLNSEAPSRTAMNDSPAIPEQDAAAKPLSDEQLMAAFSQGSTEAFSELFTRYKQPLFGFFRRRLADPSHAEELTQETFLAVLRAASRYERRALFRTYLYSIGFKILRARNTTDADVSLRHAVGKLERTEREILLLREFEQLSYAEIAELLRLPVNTVRSRLFRARMALRDLLTAPAPKTASTELKESEGRA